MRVPTLARWGGYARRVLVCWLVRQARRHVVGRASTCKIIEIIVEVVGRPVARARSVLRGLVFVRRDCPNAAGCVWIRLIRLCIVEAVGRCAQQAKFAREGLAQQRAGGGVCCAGLCAWIRKRTLLIVAAARPLVARERIVRVGLVRVCRTFRTFARQDAPTHKAIRKTAGPVGRSVLCPMRASRGFVAWPVKRERPNVAAFAPTSSRILRIVGLVGTPVRRGRFVAAELAWIVAPAANVQQGSRVVLVCARTVHQAAGRSRRFLRQGR